MAPQTRIEAICSHVVVRAGTRGSYRYALATDDKALTVVGPWCPTKTLAWERGLAALTDAGRVVST